MSAGTFFVVEKMGEHQGETPEGFLVVEGVPLARTGAQLYSDKEVPVKGDSNGRVIVMRDEDEVFKPSMIASLNGKPVVLDHPDEDVTPQNYKDLAVGHVVNVRRGAGVFDNLLIGDLLLYDPKAIKAIRDKTMRDLSVGYQADYDDLGNGRGKQRNIIANHLAIVDNGRCGPICRIGDRAHPSGVTRDACTCGGTKDGTVSQEEAQYVATTPKQDERCGVCKHYLGDGACDIVSGVINPDGWSKYFEMKAERGAPAATKDSAEPSVWQRPQRSRHIHIHF
jgi:uncharacterized protein